MILIIVLAIAIVALFVFRAKQNKAETTPQKSKTADKKATSKASTSAKAAVTTKSESTTKPKVKLDIENLSSKLDILIADKQYSKAEGLINVSLKEDNTAHALYFKLLEIYQLQNDNFAVKQLFDNVQKQNLNEVYQQLYSTHEEFKQSDAFKNQVNDVHPTSSESASTYDIPSDSSQETALHSPQVDETAHADLDFDTLSLKESSTTETEPAVNEAESHTLDFDLSSSTTTQEPAESSALEFKLDEPATQQSSEAQTLDFKLEETSTPTSSDTTLEFDVTSTQEDFRLDEEISITESPSSQVESTTINIDEEPEFADPNDPITQAFPILSQLDPIDLNIDLAEQYIQLGEPQAAKALLEEFHETLSNEQRSKIEQLLQKIA